MSQRFAVLIVGYKEIGVSLKTNPARVKEYFLASRLNPTTVDYLRESWCTHFVYWVLQQSGIVGAVEKTPGGEKSTSRFDKAFKRATTPQPGDLYYMPVVGGRVTHHVGFVNNIFENEIESLDGNAGDWRDPRTQWGEGRSGGGMVCHNRRKKKEIAWFWNLMDLKAK